MRILVLLIIGLLAAGQAGADRQGDSRGWKSDRSASSSQRVSQRASYSAKRSAWQQSRKSRYSARLTWLKSTGMNSGVCDELKGSNRGLRMMCMAFCELQACSPDYTLDDPFQNCPRSSKWILARYEQRRGPGDPDMPCVKQPEAVAECPCWSREELAGVRGTSADDQVAACTINSDYPTANILNYDTWRIFNDPTSALPYSTSLSSFGSYGADAAPTCQIMDSSSNVSRLMAVTPEQFAACEADVAQSAVNRGLACDDMSPQ